MLTGLGDDLRRTELPNLFAHSVVPIIVGYIVAHYLSYLVEVGQLTLINLSDPFSNGSNWFGTADLAPNYGSTTTRRCSRRSRCSRSSSATCWA